ALLLLFHPVHGGGAVMDFADLVADTRVEQDALGRGGLAGIDVGHDAEVAVTLDGSGARHDGDLSIGWGRMAERRPRAASSTCCRGACPGLVRARVARPSSHHR